MWLNNNKLPAYAKLSAQFAAATLVCCIAFALLFFALHLNGQSEEAKARMTFIQQSIANPDLNAEQIAQRLLTHKDMRSLSFYSADFNQSVSFGLPIEKASVNALAKQESWKIDSKHFQRIALQNSMLGLEFSPKFALVSWDETPRALKHYQFLFASLIILLISLAFIVWPVYKIRYQIDKPLNELIQNLKDIKQDSEGLKVGNAGIYEPLIQAIEQALTKQRLNSGHAQELIEAATTDLRETLESVEIQNIELDIARKNALELNQIKSEFLKKTSQDLRTPLNGILGFSELLKKSSLAAEQFEFVTTIEDSTKGILAIVNDIQDFSRLESGHLTLENKAIDLIGIVEHAITLQAPLRQERNINIYCFYDQDIPNNLLGDSLRIQQLLANLISSAAKFVGTSYVAVSIDKVASASGSASFQFNIRCDGRAAESYQNTAIRSLQSKRDDDAPDVYSNADIGLSIARGLVQHMQGDIGFDNSTNNESRFWFRITLELDSASSESNAAIDPTLQINALVFANNDLSYQEITSRLVRLGIKNQRADSFSDIVDLARKIHTEWQQRSRFFPVVVIEAQTSQQTIDKIMLNQTLETLTTELKLPAIAILPQGQYESLERSLRELDLAILQRPLQTHKFTKALLDRLGIINTRRQISKSAPRHDQPKIQILLVDDNPANVKLTSALLKDFNAEVKVANTGASAVELFRSNVFHLVLMDIQLPDSDGYQVTEQLRAIEVQGSRTPIVALTAHSIEENKSKLLLAGMDDCLSKPANNEKMAEILERWVQDIGSVAPTLETPQQEAPPSASKASPVNISDSLKLAKNDKALAQDMLQMLIESLPTEIQGIRDATETNDIKKLHEIIHRVHGGACYCGVPDLRKACALTDHNLKDNRLDNIQEEVKVILLRLEELVQWAESHDLNALFLD